ncbi:MAG TPA: aldehyde dehydrogenase family protein [Gemmatimonadales bacterium]|nr:aldehyde dehydrogenase family protein [Gemmatimonadales bacterium]
MSVHAPQHTVSARAPGVAGSGPTGQRRLDEMIARLQESAPLFLRWPIGERITLARAMQAGMLHVAKRMVRASCEAKGIPVGTPTEGEEWATGPWAVVRHLRLVAESLAALERMGDTAMGPLERRADGTLSVRVIPANRIDGVLFAGITTEVRFLPEMTPERVASSRAAFYKGASHNGVVCLVLGAGNLAMIPAMDVITKLFNEGKACLLKMNPVNAYLGPLYEEAFAEAIRRGVLRIAYGGADEGAYLVHHDGVDEIHLTGSDRTYDHIVWGAPGPERESRKALNQPLVTKPVTAELGNVSPVLVVPGPYRDSELEFQAWSIAAAVANNASFNCNSPKLLVTPRGWARRAALLDGLGRGLGAVPVRRAYYPGAEDRWQQLTRGRSDTRMIGRPGPGELPWSIIPGLDATDPREPAFITEPFCSVLSETEVGSDDPIEFLDRAVEFANNRLWGTLSADLVIHPKSMRDPRIAGAVEQAISRLRYGAVTVNSWSGFLFTYGTPPWGAYPGSTAQDIQSGTGWVHNTLMLEGVEKAVLRHPITLVPKPATFPGHRTAPTLFRRLTALEERASWLRVPGVVAAAMRG